MVDQEKILDVSYGTFSCRLEGFDDPVRTMKSVVKYFHQISGHDRFIDMDPQAPDEEEIEKLASAREGAATVTTDPETKKITLRKLSGDAAGPEQAEERPSLRLPRASSPDAEDLGTTLDAEDAGLSDGPDDEITAEAAQDIDAEAEATVAPDTEGSADPTDLPAQQDVSAQDWQHDGIDTGADNTAAADAIAVEDDDTSTVDARVAEADGQETRAPQEAIATHEAETSDDEASQSVASKLRRIRAVVSRDVGPTGDGAVRLQDDAPSATVPLADLYTRPDTPRADAADQSETSQDMSQADDISSEDDHMLGEGDDLGETMPESAEAEPTPLRSPLRRVPSRLENLSDDVDEKMTRMMSKAEERLSEPEGRRQRDAFAQLKAAVAATEAARRLGDKDGANQDPGDVFRDDLDAHEAEAEEAGSAALESMADAEVEVESADDAQVAATPSAPPLRLVAAQRVDDVDEDAATTDRLRQIAAKTEAVKRDAPDFGAFVQDQGANELGDLMEAAAAYIAFVECDPDFSRPQVMKKVQSVTQEEISREDGLRSFGRLLRQNKIVKLKNGRFQVSDNTRFRPEHLAS